MRIGFIAFFLLIASISAAQIKLRLEFPSEGTREVWVSPAPPTGQLPETITVEGKSTVFVPGSFGPNDKLFVLDKTTGNLAVKPLSQVSGSWMIAASDFNRIGKVTIRVEHEGRAVETASVAIKSGTYNSSSLLDKSSNGQTTFFAVPAGSVQATVQYKTTDGSSPDPIRQSTDLKLRRSNPEPVIVVSIPDEVATISGGASTSTAESGEPKERGGFGSLGQLLWFLIAVAIAAAAVWFFLKWLKANQDKVQGKLSAMGVEIPGQTKEPAADAYAPQKPIAPPPPEKILLDDAAPSPTAPAAVAMMTQPRLMSTDGDALPLEEGTLEVGRDAGLGLSLINESTVSRRHAEIIKSGSQVVVKDLGSTNGTFVNGVKVVGEKELRPGDHVQFGAVKFRFEG